MDTLENYKTFIIDSYSIDVESLKATFEYSLDNKIRFSEEIQFPKPKNLTKQKIELLSHILRYVQIMLGISYFKSVNPSNILINNNPLNKEQAKFFNKIYNLGLGEYAYKNKLVVDVNFPYSDKVLNTTIAENLEDKILLPIGGGKDSIVSLEIIKKLKKDFILFYVGESFLIKNFTEKYKLPIVYVKRKICKNLIELNKKGALNGHVPITAINSFLSLITAFLFDIKNIYFSNEQSANSGNLEYNGKIVNHQYSKSFDFENDFRSFIYSIGFKKINYASILRPVSELLVFKKFSKLSKYFDVFSSCNSNFKIQDKQTQILWCGECPKCAFVYIMLAPYVETKELVSIFGKDLLETKELIGLFEELAGLKNYKPFECVGEVNEVKISIKKLFDIEGYKEKSVITHFKTNWKDKINATNEERFARINKEHNLDKELFKLLETELL